MTLAKDQKVSNDLSKKINRDKAMTLAQDNKVNNDPST